MVSTAKQDAIGKLRALNGGGIAVNNGQQTIQALACCTASEAIFHYIYERMINMEKITLTHEQSEALIELLKTHTPAKIVRDFVDEVFPVRHPLYDISLDSLIHALYFGYVAEKVKFERQVGDVYDRKQFEYKVEAKIQHESKKDTFVYLVSRREYGTDDYEYFTEQY